MSQENARGKSGWARLGQPTLVLGAAILASLTGCGEGSDLRRAAELKAMEVVGEAAQARMPDEVAGGFHKIPVEVVELGDDIYQVMGISNTHVINTSAGAVMFDSGLSIQSAKQIEKLKPYVKGEISHIILSHSHSDHIGGVRFWREENTQIVAHRKFSEEQRYLSELEPYLHNRNRVLFPWLPEELPQVDMLKYGGVEPDILVDHNDYKFEQGGVQFEVLATPGAEGEDNISLWLPQQKMLFVGDTLGPNFPQFPNVFTMRGEKVRKPIEYIDTLNKMLALDPQVLVMGHHQHYTDPAEIKAGLTRIRDAVQYVHDAVVDGMNAGKTVHELMAEVKLPPNLSLTQLHGKVSWAVRSIWEYYATWFHFDSPTELYSVPARSVYAEVGALAGVDVLVDTANRAVDSGEHNKALHFLEMAVAAEPNNERALRAQLGIYQKLLKDAQYVIENNYEKDYMRILIKQIEEKLGEE